MCSMNTFKIKGWLVKREDEEKQKERGLCGALSWLPVTFVSCQQSQSAASCTQIRALRLGALDGWTWWTMSRVAGCRVHHWDTRGILYVILLRSHVLLVKWKIASYNLLDLFLRIIKMPLLTLCLLAFRFICRDTLGLVLFQVKAVFFWHDSTYWSD